MRFTEVESPSPNYTAAPPHERLGVCFHHTESALAAALQRLSDPATEVSYHWVIADDGTRYRLVDEAHVAWHAGVSTFQGRSRCNAFLLGVAFAGDTAARPLTVQQIDSCLEWLAPRWQRYGWTARWMTDHRNIAPGRKRDLEPGQWMRLQQAIQAHFGG